MQIGDLPLILTGSEVVKEGQYDYLLHAHMLHVYGEMLKRGEVSGVVCRQGCADMAWLLRL